jgi:3-hydroxyisobutyrate dehydrogenase-like beta-hydroxyacid dehydrogenase
MTRVAVLGTGRMGGAMARRLNASGLELTVWNRTAEKAQALKVGRVAPTPAEAVTGADLVISSLTNDAAVREVYLGAGGVMATAGGRVLIDMSTAGPGVAEALGHEARGSDARFVAAPVVGSVPAVESGTLLILASGDSSDVETARPVLERLGEVRYLGNDIASGPRMKLVANSMLGVVSAVAAELLAAGTASGLAREQVFAILTRFAPALKAREAGFLHDQHQPTMFAVRDLLKDLDLAVDQFSRAEVQVPLTLEARELFGDVMAQWPDYDISAIVRRYQIVKVGQALR